MANPKPIHPTERAAAAARNRVAREAAFRSRTVWGLLFVIILLLIASIVLLSDRSGSPQSAAEPIAKEDVDEIASAEDTLATDQVVSPVAVIEKPQPTIPTVIVANKPLVESPSLPKSKTENTTKAPDPVTIEIKPPVERPDLPKAPTLVKPELPQSKPKVQLIDVAFLSTSLPEVSPGSPAPARSITLLEFPSSPADLKLTLHGMDELNAKLAKTNRDPKIELRSIYSAKDHTLSVVDATSGDELATFFQHRRELRFRWKPRAALSVVQQQLRDYCVLHVSWKGHPGRYYALHDVYARSARRVRDQQLRLRRVELPTGIDRENLYLGSGKLEIADVYSHRFLTSPLARQAEVPTLKRSRKDPPLFIKIEWQDNALALKLDAKVNNEDDTRRRRKLFEHVDGDFHLHASLYRVVENKYKVEVLRLGSP
jgi:hypothetical protein